MSQLLSQWILPKDTFFRDTPNGDFVEHAGTPVKALNLALSETQKQLFNSFIRIKDIESARQWIKQYGCPWASLDTARLAYYGSDDVVGLAKSLRWIRDFSQLVKYQEVPLIRKHLRIQTQLERESSRITEEEWNQINSRLNAGIYEMDDMVAWHSITTADENPEHGFAIFTRLPDYETEIVYLDDGLKMGRPRPLEAFVHAVEFETKNLKRIKEDDDFLVRVANIYLKKALECLLTDFRPVINIYQKPGPVYSLEQSFPTRTPWEAMVKHLLHEVTASAAPKVCKNPKCDTKFVPKRADQVFCSKAACRKAESRRKQKTNQ